MSMAEARDRSKYKWASDPRNTFWANDSEKYGQKMLQRMGWNEGEGLGADGRKGNTTHVKVKKKSNMLGIGATIDNDYNWLAAQDAFSEVLAGLNDSISSPSSESKEAKEEKKPVTQRQKMLYSRFRKSKDLGNYTENDLGCILGHSELRPDRFKPKEELEDKKDEEQTDGVTAVQTIVRKESVADYFAAKLAAKLKGTSGGSTPTTTTASASASEASSETEEPAKKKKSKKEKKSKDADAEEEEEEEKTSKKKGEKRKHEEEAEAEVEAEESKKKEKKDKKKKKSKSKNKDE